MLLEGINPVISFQKKLYLHFLKRVYKLTGKKNGTLTHYEMEFQSSLPREYRIAHPDQLLDSFQNSDIVLFGDFHTLVNSQEFLLKTLKNYVSKNGSAKIGIALEAFLLRDKNYIDLFLSNKIDEEEFLKKTEYYKKWSFPWAHYRKILLFAKKKSIPVFPVNSHLKDVYLRDKDISKNLIRSLKSMGKKGKIFCLIGEFHLAEKHLQLQLIYRNCTFRNSARPMRILSNVDEYFFHKDGIKNGSLPDCLFLSKNYYCLLDTPPWIKWFTYAQWEDDLEQEVLHIREQEGLDANDYVRFSSSYDDVEFFLGELIKKIASFFHITVNLNEFYRYRLEETPKNKNYFHGNTSKNNFFFNEFISFRSHFLSFSEDKIFYSKLTLGSLVSSAGTVLFSLKLKKKKISTAEEYFSRSFLTLVLSFFCEFLLNPHSQLQKNKASFLQPLNIEEPNFLGFLAFLDSLNSSQSEEEVLNKICEIQEENKLYFIFLSYCLAAALFQKILVDGEVFLLRFQKVFFMNFRKRHLKQVLREVISLC